eukprot:TRINITY_DN931_c0_g1_i41.p1 TRINITY_DN931_c0_g1~~TRINITY_DN931_c0_g1_i41.p1  ORF type:complete len:151 (+),score=24.93 TRINITY_DN931_c0_g1_i41:762-1214(+)
MSPSECGAPSPFLSASTFSFTPSKDVDAGSLDLGGLKNSSSLSVFRIENAGFCGGPRLIEASTFCASPSFNFIFLISGGSSMSFFFFTILSIIDFFGSFGGSVLLMIFFSSPAAIGVVFFTAAEFCPVAPLSFALVSRSSLAAGLVPDEF